MESVVTGRKFKLIQKGTRVDFEIVFNADDPNQRVRKSRSGVITNILLSHRLVSDINSRESIFYEIRVESRLRGNVTTYIPAKNISSARLAPEKIIQVSTFKELQGFVKEEFPDYICENIFEQISLDETWL